MTEEISISEPATLVASAPQHKKSRNTKEDFFLGEREEEQATQATSMGAGSLQGGERGKHHHRRTHSKTFDVRFVQALLGGSSGGGL